MAESKDTRRKPDQRPPDYCCARKAVGLTDHLVKLVSSIKDGDPLAPVTVIRAHCLRKPEHPQGIGPEWFGQREVHGAPPACPNCWGRQRWQPWGRRPLTSIVESAIVRAVASRATGVLSGLHSHPSTIRSIRNTFRQMRHATDEALESLGNQDDLRREVTSLYRDFREQTQGRYYDTEDLAQAAAEAVGSGRAAGLADLGFILFFQLRSLSPGERALVQALAESDACAVLLGLTGDPEARWAHRGTRCGAFALPGQPRAAGTRRRHAAACPARSGQATSHRARPSRGGPVGDPSAGAPGGARHAVPPNGRALRRPRPPTTPWCPRSCSLPAIPVSGPNASALADTAVGRTLRGLLGLSGGEFKRHDVMDWLMSCPVQTRDSHDKEGHSPSNWDAISRKSGVVSGVAQWNERLERYASETQRASLARERKGEISEAQTAQLMAEVRAARNLARFILNLASDLEPPQQPARESSPVPTAVGVAWEEYSNWVKRLLDRYLVRPERMPGHEQAALDRVRDILTGLASVGEVQPSPTLELFRETLVEALQAPVGHFGVTGTGGVRRPHCRRRRNVLRYRPHRGHDRRRGPFLHRRRPADS